MSHDTDKLRGFRSDRTDTADKFPVSAETDAHMRLKADIERLTWLLDQLDISTQAIFRSYTWRLGRVLTWPLRRFGLISSGSVAEHIANLFGEYRHWRDSRVPQAVESPVQHHKASAVATVGRLLNRNTARLLVLAVRDIPRTGLRGFTRRAFNFIEINRTVATSPSTRDLAEILPLFRLGHGSQAVLSLDRPVDIVLPVYNGLGFLQVLLPQLISNTDLPYRLIIVDDASPELAVRAYLDEFQARHEHVILLRSDRNRGFVESVNLAFQHVENHFVILNQDTEVPPGWLSRLISPLIDNPRIASTTPYTNAGTICSFPRFPDDSELFAGLDVERLDRCFQLVDRLATGYPELPTGIGFCMGINKQVADRIGLFDAETFGRGYGEENDWCLRAVENGYRNVMVPDLFVYHKHGGSFTPGDKQHLMSNNLRKLIERYPDYTAKVQDFIQRDPMRGVRQFMIMLAAMREVSTANRLIVNHDLGGGATTYLEQRLPSWLAADEAVLLLNYNFAQARFLLIFRFRAWQVSFVVSNPLTELSLMVQFIDFDHIEVNSLVSYPDVPGMLELLRTLQTNTNARLNYYLHDYHAVCPVYTLLNHEQRYCGVPDNKRVCEYCLAHNSGEFRLFYHDELDIKTWRKKWGEFFKETDQVVCFSNSSAEILQKAYAREIRQTEITIEPHIVENLPPITVPPLRQGTLRIGVLGAINAAKGIGIIKAMVERIEREQLDVRIVIIGYTSEPLPSSVVITTGQYRREELPELVERHGIHVFFLPSICPETYMLTADEVMMLGMPLAVFNLGAPPERVGAYKRGLVIESCDSSQALDEIMAWMNQ